MKKFLYTLVTEIEVHANSIAKADLAVRHCRVVAPADGVEQLPGSTRTYRYHIEKRTTALHFAKKLND